MNTQSQWEIIYNAIPKDQDNIFLPDHTREEIANCINEALDRFRIIKCIIPEGYVALPKPNYKNKDGKIAQGIKHYHSDGVSYTWIARADHLSDTETKHTCSDPTHHAMEIGLKDECMACKSIE